MLTVQCKVHFQVGRKSRKKLEVGEAPPDPEALVEPGRVPRVSRLMALAIHLERLLAEGVARDYADLARLGGVTRARLTQIMKLTLLAPDIQEAVLFLPRTLRGRDRTNNERSTWSVLPDLAIENVRSEMVSSTSVALIARVVNLGTIPSEQCDLAWRAGALAAR